MGSQMTSNLPGAAILDTYFQLIAESGLNSLNLTNDQTATINAMKLAQLSALGFDKMSPQNLLDRLVQLNHNHTDYKIDPSDYLYRNDSSNGHGYDHGHQVNHNEKVTEDNVVDSSDDEGTIYSDDDQDEVGQGREQDQEPIKAAE